MPVLLQLILYLYLYNCSCCTTDLVCQVYKDFYSGISVLYFVLYVLIFIFIVEYELQNSSHEYLNSAHTQKIYDYGVQLIIYSSKI